MFNINTVFLVILSLHSSHVVDYIVCQHSLCLRTVYVSEKKKILVLKKELYIAI